MLHNRAVAILKSLRRGRHWSARQALALVLSLDKLSFPRLTDYAEAITAAILGQRWEARSGRPGYDTANTLARWLGKRARQYGNPGTLFDAKTQQDGIGYSDKVIERANKATQFNELRERGKKVVNGVVFHTTSGAFFQLGIDHQSTRPRFGTSQRPIVLPAALAGWIDGGGGILPGVLLSSTITWDGSGFDGLEKEGIQEVDRTLTKILKDVLAEVGMEKLQKHLDTQAKKAVKQVTKRMLANKTSRDILAEQVGENEQAFETAARNPKARETDTYRSILEEGEEKATREGILLVGEERLGAPEESIKGRLSGTTDLARLKRMMRRAATAASWQEILDTP
jgi:hypothetical protein